LISKINSFDRQDGQQKNPKKIVQHAHRRFDQFLLFTLFNCSFFKVKSNKIRDILIQEINSHFDIQGMYSVIENKQTSRMVFILRQHEYFIKNKHIDKIQFYFSKNF